MTCALSAQVHFHIFSSSRTISLMGILKKRCKTYGCRNFHHNVSGYCDECTARYNETHPRKEPDRPSAAKRGYDWRWRKFAADYLKQHPTCAICGAAATCVDHKDMTADMMMDAYGRFDYDPSHYQALCSSCNARKGFREDKAMRARYEQDKQDLSAISSPEGEGEKNQNPSSTALGSVSPTHERFD